jgi:hypothetical protein
MPLTETGTLTESEFVGMADSIPELHSRVLDCSYSAYARDPSSSRQVHKVALGCAIPLHEFPARGIEETLREHYSCTSSDMPMSRLL